MWRTALFLLATLGGPHLVGPTIGEFAGALTTFTGKPVQPADLRHLRCKGFGADEPTEAACSWQERFGTH